MLNYPQKATLPFILAELNVSEQALLDEGILPDELVAIYNDYLPRLPELADIAELTARTLSKSAGIHAIKHRLKDPLHLIQKVIRKKQEYPHRTINHTNYLDYINDLVGIRVLYLLKGGWVEIAQYIQQVWELKRRGQAYIKAGATEMMQLCEANNCDIKLHPGGYTAVHFVIETKPNKQRYYAEIQLRTLYQEAWSVLDHHLRYPNHSYDGILDDLLQVHYNITTSADELALLINTFAQQLKDPSASSQAKTEVIQRLREHIGKLPLPDAEKLHLCKRLDEV